MSTSNDNVPAGYDRLLANALAQMNHHDRNRRHQGPWMRQPAPRDWAAALADEYRPASERERCHRGMVAFFRQYPVYTVAFLAGVVAELSGLLDDDDPWTGLSGTLVLSDLSARTSGRRVGSGAAGGPMSHGVGRVPGAGRLGDTQGLQPGVLVAGHHPNREVTGAVWADGRPLVAPRISAVAQSPEWADFIDPEGLDRPEDIRFGTRVSASIGPIVGDTSGPWHDVATALLAFAAHDPDNFRSTLATAYRHTVSPRPRAVPDLWGTPTADPGTPVRTTTTAASSTPPTHNWASGDVESHRLAAEEPVQLLLTSVEAVIGWLTARSQIYTCISLLDDVTHFWLAAADHLVRGQPILYSFDPSPAWSASSGGYTTSYMRPQHPSAPRL
ncbi:hypothetical protein [Nocardioides sp.]|uniref:hypothetical protein n=1 Tax=Nocardioides sp. TaxID=35761 RepID=UPI003516D49B